MRPALGAALLAALLLSGCGQVAHDAPRTTRVRMTFRPVLSNAVVLIAERGGYFRKHGLDVEFVELGHNRDSLPALIEGEVDVLTGTVNPAYFNAIAKGAGVRLVAEMGHLAPDGCTYAALVARKELLREGTLQAPGGSRKVRVGLRRGSLSEFILQRALDEDEIAADRVEIGYLPGNAEIGALQNGAIDVVMGNAGWLDRIVRSGAGAVWHPAQSLVPDFPFVIMMYGPRLLKGDPEIGRRFMVAYLEAVRQYNEGKTERNLRILETRIGLERETLKASCWIPIRDGARLDVQSLVEFQAWARSKGLLDRELAAEEFWEPGFAQFAAEALDSAARRASAQR